MMLTAVLLPAPEGGFTALNPETGSASQGARSMRRLRISKRRQDSISKNFRLMRPGRP